MIGKSIPGKLNNRTIVRFIDSLRKVERLIKRDFSANDVSNKQAFSRLMETPSHGTFIPAGMRAVKISPRAALIERQSELKDMSLGKSTLDYSGCEVIAVYNLLQSYSDRDFAVPLPTLIEIFEHDGILRAGRFGVSPRAMAEYLKGLGLRVNFTTDETDFDVLGFFCDHFILTVMNDRNDIFKQVHTFYISKEKGGFVAHNAGLRDRCLSISEVIRRLPEGRAKGLCLIGLKE